MLTWTEKIDLREFFFFNGILLLPLSYFLKVGSKFIVNNINILFVSIEILLKVWEGSRYPEQTSEESTFQILMESGFNFTHLIFLTHVS